MFLVEPSNPFLQEKCRDFETRDMSIDMRSQMAIYIYLLYLSHCRFWSNKDPS